ncbi:uncharacterized protein LOC134255971 [Saccostrea cucullata]|uniref:uncharacterized protein LOC134255971 n=1 Tax=Saccostrea cuccullata TaxID=36930 RepID=UPI002ED354A7
MIMECKLLLLIQLSVFCAVFHDINPATIHHASTTKKVTTTTHRPTHEHGEWTNSYYRYDHYSHFLCHFHSSRLIQYCHCYHVPFEDRSDIHSPLKMFEMEKHMAELYVAGNHVLMNDLRMYSKLNYDMCHNHGKRPNITIYRLYDNL